MDYINWGWVIGVVLGFIGGVIWTLWFIYHLLKDEFTLEKRAARKDKANGKE